MLNKALYAFESDTLGKGLQISQDVLEKLDLELHGAHPLAGGRFLFLAFQGASKAPSAQQFKTLLRGDLGLVLESPHPDLVRGLLHLQPDASPEATGVVVLESTSPVSLLATLDEHLKVPGLELYQLNLGLKNNAFALLAAQPSVSFSAPCSPQVTRTHIQNISPKWRKQYFI